MTPIALVAGASANDHAVAASATLSAIAIVLLGRAIVTIAARAFRS
jgi:hypothetical protein